MFIEITRVGTGAKSIINTDRILRVSPSNTGAHTDIVMSDIRICAKESYEEIRSMLIAKPIMLAETNEVPNVVLEEIQKKLDNAVIERTQWWHDAETANAVKEVLFGKDSPIHKINPDNFLEES